MEIIRKVCCNCVGIGNRWKVDGNKLERIGEFAVLGGDGGNARKRGECQAGGTADVRYMVFVLKTGKYGS